MKLLLTILGFPVVVIMLIVGLPLLFLCAVGLYGYGALIVHAIWLEFKMRFSRRSISKSELNARLTSQAQAGTLIFESYTPGWPVARLWWTPDALTVSNPQSEPVDHDERLKLEMSDDRGKISDVYLDLKTGSALLVKSWVNRKSREKWQRLFPNLPQIHIWSGGIAMQRRFERDA